MATSWTTNKIRKAWLDFWKSKGHFEVPSKSLIPVNDPSLIWINSGVATLKKYFSGIENPPSRRLVNSQKAIRTNDIENVGLTSRHHTFFEMLGNFSIGDYFKTEAITWGYELLTKVFGLEVSRLYITVYQDDTDAYDMWVKCGIDPTHIVKCNKDRNFWDVGQGPCGPCSEIYYDRGEKFDPKHLGEKLFKEDIENDRYVEIWNIVFSQYNNDGKNNYTELAHKNIDTGSGLERLACVLQDTYTNFEIDIYQDIIKAIATLTDKVYNPDNYLHPSKEQTQINYAFRIIADHIKACTFAIADGAIPSNKDRGYIIRKLARRAIIYAHKLNISGSIVKTVVEAIVKSMNDYYPYLTNEKAKVVTTLEKEESQFKQTLKKGMELFEHSIKNNAIAGDVAFKLLDTYGFPIELTQELAAENNVKVDMNGFKKCQEQHSQVSKTVAPTKAMAIQNATLMDYHEESLFFYDKNETEAKVIGIFDQDFNKIDRVIDDKHNWVVLDKTVLYATCGGEVSDWGWIELNNNKLKVYDVIKGPNGQHFHSIVGVKGLDIALGTKVKVSVDLQAKAIIAATHTTEHLVQAALKQTVDVNIKQMGALKTHHKLTFDFQWPKKLTDQQLEQVESLINKWIKQALPVTTHLKTLQEAQDMGALAYFEEVYAKVKGKLRVVQVGDISIEICAGRHVSNTSQIEQFHILKLTSKGSGAWRLEGIVTNANTNHTINELNSNLQAKLDLINKEINESGFDNKQFINKVKAVKLQDNWQAVKDNTILIDELNDQFYKELVAFKKNASLKMVDQLVNEVKVSDNKQYHLVQLNNIPSNVLAPFAQAIVNKYPNNGFVIVNQTDKLSYIVCKHPKASVKSASEVIKEINNLTSGRGGGKDNYCQGSCLTADNLPKIVELVKKMK
ncbi:MAG: alanine--tRNA ligase [Mycoplasmoidaceae bacterium]